MVEERKPIIKGKQSIVEGDQPQKKHGPTFDSETLREETVINRDKKSEDTKHKE